MAASQDINSIPPANKPGAGLGGTPLHCTLFELKNDDGSALTVAGAAGTFKIVNTTATSVALVGETANNNTKTDKAIWAIITPTWYDSTGNSNMTLKVNVGYQNSAGGTLGTHTIAAHAYKIKSSIGGSYLTDLVVTASQVLQSTTQQDYAFLIANPTGLGPGDRLVIQVVLAIQESAGLGNIIGSIYAISLT